MSDEPKRRSAVSVQPIIGRGSRRGYAGDRRRRPALHLGLPLLASLIIHVLVVGFLAQKTFSISAHPRIDVGEWEGSVVAADESDSAFQWSNENTLDTFAQDEVDFSFDRSNSLQDGISFDVAELDAVDDGKGAGSGTDFGEGALSLLGTGSGAGTAGTGGFGGGFGGGSGVGKAGIWNLRVRANSIAYVVDFSGSIIVAADDLKRELKRSIGRLKPTQSFNVVIFYSTGGGRDEQFRTESFKPQLQPATSDIRRKFFTWIDRQAPRGQTEPLQAIKRALSLEPDVVFFFSDGYFDDSLVDAIKKANRTTRARIYCVVFDEILLQDTSGLPRETEGARRLRRVAEGNFGKVKIVTGNDLAR